MVTKKTFLCILPVWSLATLALANGTVNPTPYIPAQCYTNPVSDNGQVANPCYVCHTQSIKPNFLNDSDVQRSFSFTEPALNNHWTNYFKGFSERAQQISHQAILDYVRENNLIDQQGNNQLAQYIEKNIDQYDSNQNGRWDGYLPDIYYQFDEEGFDLRPDGSETGWRSFAYYPFPGAFMPTNGSSDDVIIRLPPPFRTDAHGQPSRHIYKTNLAIIEALIKQQDIPIAPTDEKTLDVDLDKDGKLDIAHIVRYDWAPLEGRFMSYVGKAKQLLASKKLHLAAGLYPEGTEFIHSVRYLDINQQQTVSMAPRMKELRYARKTHWMNYYQLEQIAAKELKERHDFPDRTKQIIGSVESGVSIPQGWVYQGFIENAQGKLRPQTLEEHAFCTGCHSGIGATIDTTFAFKRKLNSDHFQQGWYHWSQKGLQGVAEPRRQSDGEYEYSFYLKQNPTGDEYRSNQEVKQKFYHPDGSPKTEAFTALHTDISELLLPSAERALALNKAYKALVEEQSFIQGRESILVDGDVVFESVELDQETGIKEAINFF